MTDDRVGIMAVRAAREAIRSFVEASPLDFPLPPEFDRPSGVFVTLRTHPDSELRGCIGYPEPIMSLGEVLIGAARGACRDPRFPPLRKDELDSITVEVTVLSPPQPLQVNTPYDLPGVVRIGVDGLILEFKGHRGLLLPQVPVEWGWDSIEFLDNLCWKAGLAPGSWMDPAAHLWSFEGDVFGETQPNGDVRRTGSD